MSERAAFWRQVLADWEASGLSQAEFCRQQDLKAVTFAWWKRRLKGSAGARSASGAPAAQSAGRSAFVELALPARGAVGYELVLPGGACLHLPVDFDPERIARLVQVLAAAC